MDTHHSYEEAKKIVFRGLYILGIVTIVEVFIALIGNGHIVDGFTLSKIIMYPLMIILSLYKAYFILSEFMHLRYELKGLVLSIALPTLLLVWAIIAFFWEGDSWLKNREKIQEKDKIEVSDETRSMGYKFYDSQTKYF